MNKIKLFFVAIWGGVSSFLGVLEIPVLLLLCCNLIDYFTGLASASHRNQKVTSYKSFKGIVKKVCMYLLVIVGCVLDALLEYASDTVGIDFPFKFVVASVVAIWLVCNELISILENMTDIGIALPAFLLKITKYIKHQAESKADIMSDPDDAKKEDGDIAKSPEE